MFLFFLQHFRKAKGGFSKKVGRAFSLNKTPKQTTSKTNPSLKRAVR